MKKPISNSTFTNRGYDEYKEEDIFKFIINSNELEYYNVYLTGKIVVNEWYWDKENTSGILQVYRPIEKASFWGKKGN